MATVGRTGGAGAIAIDFEWVNLNLVVADMLALGVDVRSFREPLTDSIREVAAPAIRRHFDEEGPGWAALSESRVQFKSRHQLRSEILQATGRLRQVAGQINAWNVTQDSAELANLQDAEYGWVHQEGYEPMNIPQREWAYLDESDLNQIENVFGRWISMRLARRGFA